MFAACCKLPAVLAWLARSRGERGPDRPAVLFAARAKAQARRAAQRGPLQGALAAAHGSAHAGAGHGSRTLLPSATRVAAASRGTKAHSIPPFLLPEKEASRALRWPPRPWRAP